MKKGLITVTISLFILALVFGAAFLYNRPLGQALELSVPDSVAAPSDTAQEDQPESGSGKKTCGSTGVMKIITLGQSSPMDAGHFGADAIRLVWVDFDGVSVDVLALPSDLWVDADALEDPENEDLALNDIYQFAYERENSNKPEVRTRKATQVLAQAIVDNYEFVPDHYVTLQEQAFVDLVDIAEIEVDVPYDILVVPEGWHTFEAGLQTMDGEQTLDYVRFLDTQPNLTVWARFDRQNQVLFALLESALQIENWDDIPQMVKLVRKMVVTDLSVSQANSLACMLKEAEDQIELFEVPEELVEIINGHMFENPQDPDYPEYPELPLSIRDMVEEIEAGLGSD